MRQKPQLRRDGECMAKLLFADSFLDDVSLLSEYVEEAVWEKVGLVGAFPGVGSALVEPSLRALFGLDCLKVNAASYDVLFDYDRRCDEVCFLGIVHQRRVR